MNGSGTLNRSRLPPNHSENNDDASYNAALKGASLAFQKSTPKQLPTNPTSSRNVDNGALIAATSATSASRDHSRAVSRQNTGSNSIESEQRIKNQPSVQHLQSAVNRNHGASSSLGVANKQTIPDPRSPSFIAATLAASRSTSPVHQQTPQSRPYTQQSFRRQLKYSPDVDSGASSVTSLDLTTDMTSIPPTNTLISMFEKKRDDTDPVKKDVEAPETSKLLGTKPPTRPLTPSRTTSSTSKSDLSPSRLASNIAWQRTPSPSVSASNSAQEGHRKTQNLAIEAKTRPPTPPPARTTKKSHTSSPPRTIESTGKPRASTPPKSIKQVDTVILAPRPTRSASQKVLLNNIQAQDAIPPGQTSRPKPQYPPPSNEATVPSLRGDDLRRSSTSSDDTFVSASLVPTPHPSSPERSRSRPSTPDTLRVRRPLSTRTLSTEATSTSRPPVPPRRQQHSPNLPLDSLTDAIVAGSLASSRITLSKTPLPKPPSRKQTPHMRQTLRHPPSKSDDEEVARSRRRKPLGKLGGNKHIHHEGERRRWREEITPRERKRYEGVWASNRGLLLVPSDGDTLSVPSSAATGKERELEQVVANVVVRDIWTRSRLPPDELAEVWDLVDRRGRGYLDRTEFVVGMWLIDQRLRGRKIPRKVSESVWGSARGVRVAAPKRGK
ncbi:hypothetical protein K445DRAFT_313186 [Daldinia sp. EC12]|nr:hypothetical protein K445DRAFT_313186 [Daldinia sp. EC12]